MEFNSCANFWSLDEIRPDFDTAGSAGEGKITSKHLTRLFQSIYSVGIMLLGLYDVRKTLPWTISVSFGRWKLIDLANESACPALSFAGPISFQLPKLSEIFHGKVFLTL